ncbi:MAG TPA: hypothetical protein VES69_06030 [Pyrinomonadaceae bacterium]|nr:hypothetical protein [Pyrinomonadaceae bacterium]
MFRGISWIVFDFLVYLTDRQVKKLKLGHFVTVLLLSFVGPSGLWAQSTNDHDQNPQEGRAFYEELKTLNQDGLAN